jgi:uncharacterized membrane protein
MPLSRAPSALVVALLSAGCAGAADDAGADTAEDTCATYDLTWANFGAGWFATYCDACHAADAPNRYGAPENVTFDTPAEVRAWADRIRLRVLEEETMPLGGGVTADDRILLETYLDCAP